MSFLSVLLIWIFIGQEEAIYSVAVFLYCMPDSHSGFFPGHVIKVILLHLFGSFYLDFARDSVRSYPYNRAGINRISGMMFFFLWLQLYGFSILFSQEEQNGKGREVFELASMSTELTAGRIY